MGGLPLPTTHSSSTSYTHDTPLQIITEGGPQQYVILALHSLCFTKKHTFNYSRYISVHLLHEKMADCDNDVIVDVNQMTKRRVKMNLN